MLEKVSYDKYKGFKDKYEKIVNRISNVRMIMFILMIISFILKYYYYKLLFSIVFAISLVSFVILVIIHNKYFKIYDFYDKYLIILDEYIARGNGKWKDFTDKGLDFLDDENSYFSDLDIVGDASLFQFLSICKTKGGRRKLIEKLSNVEFDSKELIKNQELVKELTNDFDFCIKLQIALYEYRGKDIDLSSKLKDFSTNVECFIDGIVCFVSSFISIILLVLSLFNILPIEFFYGIFFFNLGISFIYSYIYREDFIKLESLIKHYGKLKDVFMLLAGYKASSFKLKRYVKDINNNLDKMNNLKKIDSLNSMRSNLLSNLIFNGLFCLNLLVRIKYSKFIKNDYTSLNTSILNVEELEAMISLASIGIVKNVKCMPLVSDKLYLGFKGLKHPLIDEEVCVSNDYAGKAGVNIITGSNMGGKTTFIRTIGINLILMQSGAYVCAEEFNASYFKIFTSMRVMDNVDKGISTFYGELLRIKDMIDYNGKGNMLVLIDEIFKGTNYNDRMYGAKEIVRKLNNKSTISFITTHDFELCDSDKVVNYHVKEEYEGERIIFDYKVRKGKCVSTNAKYLMKMLDIVN